MLFSALQSLLFNEVLARRVAAGTWPLVLAGDVAKKHDSGGLFDVPLEGPALDDARARAAACAITATGPMYGAKMRWPAGEPLAMERAVLDASALDDALLEARKSLGEGTRRALRLEVGEMSVAEESAGEVGTNPASHAPTGVTIASSFCATEGWLCHDGARSRLPPPRRPLASPRTPRPTPPPRPKKSRLETSARPAGSARCPAPRLLQGPLSFPTAPEPLSIHERPRPKGSRRR